MLLPTQPALIIWLPFRLLLTQLLLLRMLLPIPPPIQPAIQLQVQVMAHALLRLTVPMRKFARASVSRLMMKLPKDMMPLSPISIQSTPAQVPQIARPLLLLITKELDILSPFHVVPPNSLPVLPPSLLLLPCEFE